VFNPSREAAFARVANEHGGNLTPLLHDRPGCGGPWHIFDCADSASPIAGSGILRDDRTGWLDERLLREENRRLDYGLCDGRPQAWEINLTPVLAGNRPANRDTQRRAHAQPAASAREYARDAFRRIDPVLSLAMTFGSPAGERSGRDGPARGARNCFRTPLP
jgi:hypothetical protein